MTAGAARVHRGETAYHAGQAAEAAVARHYAGLGYRLIAERWRGARGEIDLILRDRACLVFVEVKKSRSFAAAASRLSARQMERIYTAAEEYLGGLPDGSLTDARFDVALVDASGSVRLIENAFGAW